MKMTCLLTFETVYRICHRIKFEIIERRFCASSFLVLRIEDSNVTPPLKEFMLCSYDVIMWSTG